MNLQSKVSILGGHEGRVEDDLTVQLLVGIHHTWGRERKYWAFKYIVHVVALGFIHSCQIKFVSGATLDQIMAWCLMAPSHYLSYWSPKRWWGIHWRQFHRKWSKYQSLTWPCWYNWVNTIAAYALAPCITRSSATMELTRQDKRVVVNYEEWFQPLLQWVSLTAFLGQRTSGSM